MGCRRDVPEGYITLIGGSGDPWPPELLARVLQGRAELYGEVLGNDARRAPSLRRVAFDMGDGPLSGCSWPQPGHE
jgi:hypothetical protein